ncbi:MGMT family protein [Salibacterium lacus]|uniref:MGMT family protein n=1 Tax=Salibacterium lacus TaxID=1898109 RepID=A0ABW5T2L4_9BACI
MGSGFFEQVYSIVEDIPEGRVASYSQIARILEQPRNARVVGWAMRQSPPEKEFPAHRVVKQNGDTAPGFLEQRTLLENERVAFDHKGRVRMEDYQWER